MRQQQANRPIVPPPADARQGAAPLPSCPSARLRAQYATNPIPTAPRGGSALRPTPEPSRRSPRAPVRNHRRRHQQLHLGLRHPLRRRDHPRRGDRAAGHGRVPDPAPALRAAAPPGPRLRRHHRQVRRSQRAGRRLPLPGPDHGAVGDRGHRQHRRRGHRHPLGRARRPVLDVGHRRPGHGRQVHRGDPGPALPRDRDRRFEAAGHGLGRTHVLHRAWTGTEVEMDGPLLRRHAGLHRLPDRQRRAGQHRGRHHAEHLRGRDLDHRAVHLDHRGLGGAGRHPAHRPGDGHPGPA